MKERYEVEIDGCEPQRFTHKPNARAKMAAAHRAHIGYRLYRLYAPDGKYAPPVRKLLEDWSPA